MANLSQPSHHYPYPMIHSPIQSRLTSVPAYLIALPLPLLLYAVASLTVAIFSEGFLESDAWTHYLQARFAFSNPIHWVDVWGRPLFTVVYSLPATLLGPLGVRITSLTLILCSALLTYRIAHTQNLPKPHLATLFLLSQPLLFLHSFTAMTEVLFATLLILLFRFYQTQRFLLLALFASIAPLARPEGFPLLLVIAFALLIHRRPYWIFLLPIPLLLWSFAGWKIEGPITEYPWWQWLPRHWPYSSYSLYHSGHPLHFVALLPILVSPLLFPFTCIGIVISLKSIPSLPNHLRRCHLLITLIPLLVLIGHSLLWSLGLLASYGELRYLLIVSPFFALLTAQGYDWTLQKLPIGHPFLFAIVLGLLPALILPAYPILPLKLTPQAQLAKQSAQLLQKLPCFPSQKIMASDPAIYFFLDIDRLSPNHAVPFCRYFIHHPRPNTLLIWEPYLSSANADPALAISLDEIHSAPWHEISTPIPSIHLFYFQSEP